MVIHFTSSLANIIDDFETLRRIIRVIHQTGNVLARDWMESQYQVDISKTVKELDPRQIYDLNIDAIERADLVIIEGSYKSFGSGFQAATALHRKKPVLFLVNSNRVASEGKISRGVNDPLLTRKEYANHDDLDLAVKDFLESNSIKTKDLRFNFVLDPHLYNHIRWKSFKTKKTKAEVVRELLLEDMERH